MARDIVVGLKWEESPYLFKDSGDRRLPSLAFMKSISTTAPALFISTPLVLQIKNVGNRLMRTYIRAHVEVLPRPFDVYAPSCLFSKTDSMSELLQNNAAGL